MSVMLNGRCHIESIFCTKTIFVQSLPLFYSFYVILWSEPISDVNIETFTIGKLLLWHFSKKVSNIKYNSWIMNKLRMQYVKEHSTPTDI